MNGTSTTACNVEINLKRATKPYYRKRKRPYYIKRSIAWPSGLYSMDEPLKIKRAAIDWVGMMISFLLSIFGRFSFHFITPFG